MEERVPILYRIGRAPDPFSPPPFDDNKNSGNRFDDPRGEFWVMYAAEQRRACFAETLARFRIDLELLAALQTLPDGDLPEATSDSGVVPDDWHLKRLIGAFRVAPNQEWLDLRQMTARERVRHELAATFADHGLADFDLGDALSRVCPLTQAIARWAYDQGHAGIVYTSRLDAAFDCWAIFEGASFEIVGTYAIPRTDEDFVVVATAFGLRL